jgi:tetratricopeptide (TPR) repeat protein
MNLYDPALKPGLRMSNFVSELLREGKKKEALIVAIGACELEPNRPEPLINLAGCYEQFPGCEQYQMAACRAAIDLADYEDPYCNSKLSDAWHNLSLAQNRLYQWEDAFESANKAHLLNPGNPWCIGCAAQCANQLGQRELAIKLLTGTISLIEGEGSPFVNDPPPIMAKFRRDAWAGRAISKLETGDLSGYFADYSKRFELGRDADAGVKEFREGKLWRPGQPIGKRVHVLMEGGLGDQIQFVRLVRLFCAFNQRFDEVTLNCNPVLRELFAQLPFVDFVNVDPDPSATQIASMDLVEWLFERNACYAHPFGVWSGDPYLKTSRTAAIRREPGKTAVAMCWQGNPDNNYDWARSIHFPALLEWAESNRDKYTFHSVQFGKKLFKLPDWIEDCQQPDMSALAAVLNAADIVIGPDTGVMHLAGALGRPAVMLHSFHQEWRWRLGTQIYGPDFRHLKQQVRGDWAEVLSRVGPELDEITHSNRGVEAMAH